MDLTFVAYTISVFIALLTVNAYAHWNVVEVHAFTIPPFLEERGYSPQMAASQVVDAMQRIRLEVASLNEADIVVQGHVQPVGPLASYFGFLDLLRATETTLGFGPTVLEIEITQHGEVAHWRVRGTHAVRGYLVREGEMPIEESEALINLLGQQVTSYVSPFESLASQFIQDAQSNKYDATITAASALLLDCKRRQAWTCTDTNIKNAYLLRGMAHLNSVQSVRGFEDFDAANRIGSQNGLGLAFYGDAFTAMGRTKEAKRQYQLAEQLDSGIGERFYEIARGYAQAGNYLLANHRYTTASELGIASEAFLVDWGDTLFSIGRYDAALQRYRYAEAVDAERDLYAQRIDRIIRVLEAAKVAQPEDWAAEPPRLAVARPEASIPALWVSCGR